MREGLNIRSNDSLRAIVHNAKVSVRVDQSSFDDSVFDDYMKDVQDFAMEGEGEGEGEGPLCCVSTVWLDEPVQRFYHKNGMGITAPPYVSQKRSALNSLYAVPASGSLGLARIWKDETCGDKRIYWFRRSDDDDVQVEVERTMVAALRKTWTPQPASGNPSSTSKPVSVEAQTRPQTHGLHSRAPLNDEDDDATALEKIMRMVDDDPVFAHCKDDPIAQPQSTVASKRQRTG